ncbi:hypothetical protein EIP91_011346 [Steccherinum ochraceum]|uniref:HAT C-terminal dimerisation domain-containing protein n=1 Tax=Steccherinum ochraceum TaxID=92696 RepID=A0A4R0QZS1_9APHY|nr:hypothetical protein EIP91_011346 [Steccherinum ochraceum]
MSAYGARCHSLARHRICRERWEQEQDRLDKRKVDEELRMYENSKYHGYTDGATGIANPLAPHPLLNPDHIVNPATDLCAFWQGHAHSYPALYLIALDVLPSQASAVPCERVFSSSKETDALRRGLLSPPLMEKLQMLKYLYRSQRSMQDGLDFSRMPQLADLEPSVTRETINDYLSSGRAQELDELIEQSENPDSQDSLSEPDFSSHYNPESDDFSWP